jgi:uncharacterized membrane protein YqjE
MADIRTRAVGEGPLRDPAAPPPSGAEPSIAQLLSNLVADAQTLVRKEFDLAKTEIMSEVDKVRQGAIMLGAGIALAAIGGLFLLGMVAELLVAAGLDRWVAYMILGGLLAIVGGIVLFVGIKRFQTVDPVPRETIETIKEDVSWLKEQSPSDRT